MGFPINKKNAAIAAPLAGAPLLLSGSQGQAAQPAPKTATQPPKAPAKP